MTRLATALSHSEHATLKLTHTNATHMPRTNELHHKYSVRHIFPLLFPLQNEFDVVDDVIVKEDVDDDTQAQSINAIKTGKKKKEKKSSAH